MLDKSIPYAEIWMERMAADEVAPVPDSNNYIIQPYQSGDASEWARIETAVGEFDTEAAALAYFEKTFSPMNLNCRNECFCSGSRRNKGRNSDCLVEEEARWQHCAARSLGSSHSQRSKTRDRSRLGNQSYRNMPEPNGRFRRICCRYFSPYANMESCCDWTVSTTRLQTY